MKKYRIYCAGPLFNDKEKEEMTEIAAVLEGRGFDVFLPHRDGLEYAGLSSVLEDMGISNKESMQILNKAIFNLDVFQVLNCDGLVLNMNGRVPDEGAMVEAGIAWNAGKQLVIYKNDARTLLAGNDNPLLAGLAGFKVVTSISKIPDVFNTKTSINIKEYIYGKGKILADLTRYNNKKSICEELLKLFKGSDI